MRREECVRESKMSRVSQTIRVSHWDDNPRPPISISLTMDDFTLGLTARRSKDLALQRHCVITLSIAY